jgi:hypothetical protein
LEINTDVATSFTFWIQATTTSGITAFKQFTISVVCGPTSQVIGTTADGATLYYEVVKNLGVLEVLATAEVEGLFSEETVGQCPIQTYELVHTDNDTAIVVGDDDYSLFDLANNVANELNFLSDIDAQDGQTLNITKEFKVKATAEGGAVGYQTIEIDIVVCGYEVVSLVDSTTVAESLQVRYNTTAEVNMTALFSTNDTDCPVIGFALKADDADPDTATDLNDTQTANAVIVSTNLVLSGIDPGVVPLFVQGTTVSSNYANQAVELTNTCDLLSQDIQLAADGSLEYAVDKNQDTIELVSSADLTGAFTLIDDARCIINAYEVYTEVDGALIASGDDLYTVLDIANRADTLGAISIDTTVAPTDGTVVYVPYSFAVKAVAEGGNVNWKLVDANITVCGSETLSLTDDTTYTSTLDIDQAATATEVDLAAMFATDDDYCPPNVYALFLDDTDYDTATDPSADELLNFNSTDSTMSLFPEAEGEYTFFIYAVTESGVQATRPATLTVQCVASSQTITPTADTDLVDVTKNQDTVSLLDAAAVQAFFSVADDVRCLIQNYTILDD